MLHAARLMGCATLPSVVRHSHQSVKCVDMTGERPFDVLGSAYRGGRRDCATPHITPGAAFAISSLGAGALSSHEATNFGQIRAAPLPRNRVSMVVLLYMGVRARVVATALPSGARRVPPAVAACSKHQNAAYGSWDFEEVRLSYSCAVRVC